MRNSEVCNEEVYTKGKSLGLFDMSKQQAEQYCITATERTGLLHDWHFIAGRVHIKVLIEEK